MLKLSNCDYDFCIYNNGDKCMLDNITINSEGCCAQIILPDIPKQQLDSYKKESLKHIMNRQK